MDLSFFRSIALGTCALALSACNKPAPEAPAAQPQALEQPQPPASPPTASPPPAAAPTPPTDAPSEHAEGYPRAGWSKVSVADALPLCVFANATEHAQAKLKSDVKPTKLKANSAVTFGAFGPFPCIHESCDQLPSLQCYVDQEDKTLIVHTKYSGYHKDGATCSEDCRTITAACGAWTARAARS